MKKATHTYHTLSEFTRMTVVQKSKIGKDRSCFVTYYILSFLYFCIIELNNTPFPYMLECVVLNLNFMTEDQAINESIFENI